VTSLQHFATITSRRFRFLDVLFRSSS
jgi:hypothetical protein